VSAHPLMRLAETINVEVRLKEPTGRLMHLKGYTVGGEVLRTGSANASVDGLTRQDNDLVLIYSREAAGRFDEQFEAMWQRSGNTLLRRH
jgi:phosphatidylserine/phosphatidylglycerophosphate/cardiolipin synthase-like enzyme